MSGVLNSLFVEFCSGSSSTYTPQGVVSKHRAHVAVRCPPLTIYTREGNGSLPQRGVVRLPGTLETSAWWPRINSYYSLLIIDSWGPDQHTVTDIHSLLVNPAQGRITHIPTYKMLAWGKENNLKQLFQMLYSTYNTYKSCTQSPAFEFGCLACKLHDFM